MDESNVLIKQMPMSVEAEQAILGAIIIKPESFDAIGGMLTSNDFYLEDHKRIFSTLLKMYGESKIIDTISYEICDSEPTYDEEIFTVYKSLDDIKDKYNCVVMMNVLHEIPPSEWVENLRKISTILEKSTPFIYYKKLLLIKQR
jgi:hypothetical protein